MTQSAEEKRSIAAKRLGIRPEGIIFRDAFSGGFPILTLGLMAVLSGALLTPALLPYLPFRSFALKGYIMGIAFLAAFFPTIMRSFDNNFYLNLDIIIILYKNWNICERPCKERNATNGL